MEKIAVIELNSNYVKMIEVEMEKNKFFKVFNTVCMPIDLLKGFEKDNFIQPSVIKEIINILIVYKRIVDRDEISDTICFADSIIGEAKNSNGVINELANASTFRFEITDVNSEMLDVYTGIVNSFNRPKSLIINITNYNTEFILYNRRNVLNTVSIPLGSVNLLRNNLDSIGNPQEMFDKMVGQFSEQLNDMPWAFEELSEDWDIIGSGCVFKNLGVLSRRAKKYPLDIEHNYEMSVDDLNKIVLAVKGIEPARTSKLKGLKSWESLYFNSGLAIITAFFNKSNHNKFAISTTDLIDGKLLKYAIPLTIDKPITDTLGYSLQSIVESYDKPSNILHIYELSLLLFRQIKVIHKLGRPYVRILRIASFLSGVGDRVSFIDREKSSFDIILNSRILGATHAEIVLASFVSKLREVDSFNAVDWIKYKEIIDGYDIDAIKKLAIIIKIAEALDVTKFGVVKDIDCDILGDSVILKLVVEGDAYLEVKYASTIASEFKRYFNKNLEII